MALLLEAFLRPQVVEALMSEALTDINKEFLSYWWPGHVLSYGFTVQMETVRVGWKGEDLWNSQSGSQAVRGPHQPRHRPGPALPQLVLSSGLGLSSRSWAPCLPLMPFLLSDSSLSLCLFVSFLPSCCCSSRGACALCGVCDFWG